MTASHTFAGAWPTLNGDGGSSGYSQGPLARHLSRIGGSLRVANVAQPSRKGAIASLPGATPSSLTWPRP